jgi:glycine/D-amino acid oxidase-like deaminating enzyme
MTDVLIIGGGIAGLSAAAALALHARVTLVEAEEALGTQASGRSAALFEENYGNAAVRALNRGSRAALEAAGVLSPRGLMMVALPEEDETFARGIDEMGMKEIDLDTAHAKVPILSDRISRAALHLGAMDVDTDLLMQTHARTIREAGGEVLTGHKVTGLVPVPGGWEVATSAKTFETKVVVNAAGAWADQIAALAGVAPLGLTPCRRSVARMPAPGGHDVRGWPMLFGPGETWFAKPDAGAWIVSPAEEDPTEPHDAWADDMVLAEGIERYQAHISEPVTRVTSTWAGLRTFAPDRTLVIGMSEASGFFWLAGQGGYGFQTSAAAAGLSADLILGRAPRLEADIVAALSPQRFC